MRATLEALTSELVSLKRDVAKNLHAMGVRLARIRDEALWEHGGYAGFDDGTVYVVFGQASGFPAEFDLSTLNGQIQIDEEGLEDLDRQFAAAQPGCTATSGPGPLPLAWDQAPPLALVWSLAVSLLPDSTRIMRIKVRGYLTLRDVVGGQPVRFNDSDRLTSRPHKPALPGTRR